ncbi:MAG: hypothetical protein IPI34_09380 [bacterium]|nr:hypothetical protein [bacterium]
MSPSGTTQSCRFVVEWFGRVQAKWPLLGTFCAILVSRKPPREAQMSTVAAGSPFVVQTMSTVSPAT